MYALIGVPAPALDHRLVMPMETPELYRRTPFPKCGTGSGYRRVVAGARLAGGRAGVRVAVRAGVARRGAGGRGARAVPAGRYGARAAVGRRRARLRARAPPVARLPRALACAGGT